MSRRTPAAWLKDALEGHRLRFPPPPPKFAQLFVELPDAMLETVFVTPSRRHRLRSLFPGLSDSQIVNEMIDALFAQVGVPE